MQRTLLSRPGIGTTARIIQHTSLELVRVAVDQPILIWVRNGTKILRWHDQQCVIRAGEMVAISGGQVFDITNQLPDDGGYEAIWIAWDGALIADFTLPADRFIPSIVDVWPIRETSQAFCFALQSAIAGLSEPDIPAEVAKHRLHEVLIWIALHGGCFAVQKQETVSDRVRKLVATAPADAWGAAQVARYLAMSESTLRRRLVDEATSLGDILVDVRMSFALTLLQSTDFPVGQIALDVGYESASRFAVRFRKRFGFAPTAIRGHRRQD